MVVRTKVAKAPARKIAAKAVKTTKAPAKAAKAPARKATKRPARKPLPTFKAPEDFKPHFLEVTIRTEKDGLLAGMIKATRYVGRYDPEAEDKKKFDLGSYDAKTLMGIQARLAAVTFVTNPLKRLPGNTTYRILLRINQRRTQGNILAVLFKGISKATKSEKTGKVRMVELDKKDPEYRRIRKSARILPAAFKEVMAPPARTRSRKVVEEDEE